MTEIFLGVMGSPLVGKSTLTVRYVQDIFVEDYDPTIEDQFRKILYYDGKEITLEVYDTVEMDGWDWRPPLRPFDGRRFSDS